MPRLAAWALPACLALLSCLALQPGCAGREDGNGGPGPASAPAGPLREQLHRVALREEDGRRRLIGLLLCRPPGDGPAPLVLFNHGSPVNPAARAAMRPRACESEPIAWFLAQGFVVGQPIRRGYGTSEGGWSEGYGRCGDPDFAAAGRESARDMAAALAYAQALPFVRPEGVTIVGQSAGGWGALALAASNPAHVAAVVNFAGGRGGWALGIANSNCRPDRLVAAAGAFGATARIPSLWIYTANDSFFAPEIAQAMYRAYTGAGAPAEFHALPAFGRDGHGLFVSEGGSALWGPVLARLLAGTGAATGVASAPRSGT